MNNIHFSALYSDRIQGAGPRYCPSIEDKVVRFSDKTSHQIFIEPEGLHTHEIYPNGISTSLPYDIQVELVNSIKGFENARISRPGYAIEYDFFDPSASTRSAPTCGAGCRNWHACPTSGSIVRGEAPATVLATAGVELGRSYPHPIVDFRASREAALASYGSIKGPIAQR